MLIPPRRRNFGHFFGRSRIHLGALMAMLLFAFVAITAARAEPVSPTFAELEAAGAIIREVRINPQNIFDASDETENNWLFRTANKLHVTTRPGVIAQLLLFKAGERVSKQKIEESERLLRNNRFIYDVEFKATALGDGFVDVEVTTKDTWTIDLAGNLSRAGGNNKTSIGLREYNVLGTGLRVGFVRTTDESRRGSEFDISYPQAFDGRTLLSYARGKFDDGSRQTMSVQRPFYALDARWAAGASAFEDDRIDSLYNAGDTIGQYRHKRKIAEAFGGWSPGLVDGGTQRFFFGARTQEDAYRVEPGRIRAAVLPVSQDLRTLYFRHEFIEDRFVKLRNRDQIGRPEFFRLGFASRLQLSYLPSAPTTWLYNAAVSNGFSFAHNRDLLVSAGIDGHLSSSGGAISQFSLAARYYAPQGSNALLYAALSMDRISGGGLADQLLLGGNTGLRGYPSYYQAGERRALFSIEERGYTNWYPFRLLRVGGAVFFDYGRAWGGINQNLANPGWLADVGVGLRLALDRAAFANVLHADVAWPLNRAPGIKPVQFLVKSEVTF